jgi:hypothetical protein
MEYASRAGDDGSPLMWPLRVTRRPCIASPQPNSHQSKSLSSRINSRDWRQSRVAVMRQSPPLRARQALRRRSFTPIRPHVCSNHAASSADRPPIQVQKHGVVRPAIRVDNCAVMAKSGGAVDQQSPDAMRANMTERHGRPTIGCGSSFGRWVVAGVAGVAVAHEAGSLLASVIGWGRGRRLHGHRSKATRPTSVILNRVISSYRCLAART